MTDPILKLARECGASVEQWMTTTPRPFAVHFELEQLAAFVAAVRAEEREACAKAADAVEEKPWYGYENPNTFQDGKWSAANAIRAR